MNWEIGSFNLTVNDIGSSNLSVVIKFYTFLEMVSAIPLELILYASNTVLFTHDISAHVIPSFLSCFNMYQNVLI